MARFHPKLSDSLVEEASGIDQTTFDLSVKNPNGDEEVVHRTPQEIMHGIAALDIADNALKELWCNGVQRVCFPRA